MYSFVWASNMKHGDWNELKSLTEPLSHHDILGQRKAVAVGDGVDDDAGVRVVGRQSVLHLQGN